MAAPSPSVLLVEDHALMSRMLARLLRERGKLQIWATAASAEAALEALAGAAQSNPAKLPDLVVVDVSLPGMNGIDLVAELLQLYPQLPCLVVSAHRDSSYVKQALHNGARGYVAKGDPLAVVAGAQRVLDGKLYLSDDMEDVWPE